MAKRVKSFVKQVSRLGPAVAGLSVSGPAPALPPPPDPRKPLGREHRNDPITDPYIVPAGEPGYQVIEPVYSKIPPKSAADPEITAEEFRAKLVALKKIIPELDPNAKGTIETFTDPVTNSLSIMQTDPNGTVVMKRTLSAEQMMNLPMSLSFALSHMGGLPDPSTATRAIIQQQNSVALLQGRVRELESELDRMRRINVKLSGELSAMTRAYNDLTKKSEELVDLLRAMTQVCEEAFGMELESMTFRDVVRKVTEFIRSYFL